MIIQMSIIYDELAGLSQLFNNGIVSENNSVK